MKIAGVSTTLLIAYILVALPWAALRGARRLRAARDGHGPAFPSRDALYKGTIVSLGLLLVLALLAAFDLGYPIFAWHPVVRRDVPAAMLALAVQFALARLSRAMHSDEQRRKSTVYFMAPRQRREWILWTTAVLLAGVAEEAAYRGVGWSVLSMTLGPSFGVLVCATAFALAHAAQGWKSGMVIFGFALVFHALVAFTQTLVLAMAVHVIYDMSIGYRISRDVRRDLESVHA